MLPSLWISKTGLDAQQIELSVIAHNLANVNTNGYKRSRAIFQDLLYETVRQPGADSSQNTILPTGLVLGTGVKLGATQKLFNSGSIQQTNNSLDVAINGRGFFQILTPDGEIVYSRDGQFQLDQDGQLVTSTGNPIQPAITIPPETISITIGVDGTVSALSAGNTAPTQLGNIQLADFINPAGLEPIGENLFRETVASGPPNTSNPGLNGTGTVAQGSLEGSNVNAVEELVNLIEGSRAYEMNSKAISTADDMLQFVTQTI
ncbi:MAG: flagellar basal-body rod protein FlgG [Gammaproteobacteria bacterium]